MCACVEVRVGVGVGVGGVCGGVRGYVFAGFVMAGSWSTWDGDGD